MITLLGAIGCFKGFTSMGMPKIAFDKGEVRSEVDNSAVVQGLLAFCPFDPLAGRSFVLNIINRRKFRIVQLYGIGNVQKLNAYVHFDPKLKKWSVSKIVVKPPMNIVVTEKPNCTRAYGTFLEGFPPNTPSNNGTLVSTFVGNHGHVFVTVSPFTSKIVLEQYYELGNDGKVIHSSQSNY